MFSKKEKYFYTPISMRYGQKTFLGIFSTKKKAQLAAALYEKSMVEAFGELINPVNIVAVEIDDIEGYF